MGKYHHTKSKDPEAVRTMELVRKTAVRTSIPPRQIFASKKAYNRKRMARIPLCDD